jgi:hypothetical protein
MKIIIYESQVDRVVEKYITMIFSPYKIKTNSKGSFLFKNNKIVAQYDSEQDIIIDYNILKNIQHFIAMTFNIFQTSDFIRSWFSKQLNEDLKYFNLVGGLYEDEQGHWRDFEKKLELKSKKNENINNRDTI